MKPQSKILLMLFFELFFDFWRFVTWKIVCSRLCFNPCHFGADRKRLLLILLASDFLLFCHNNANIKISEKLFNWIFQEGNKTFIKYNCYEDWNDLKLKNKNKKDVDTSLYYSLIIISIFTYCKFLLNIDIQIIFQYHLHFSHFFTR